MKKMFVLLFCLVLTGCSSSSNDTNGNNSNTAKNDPIKIEDLDWKVDESIADGKRKVMFDYINNSKYTITDFTIEFTPKKEITEDEIRKKFSDVLKEDSLDNEVLKDVSIEGRSHEICKPSEASNPGDCGYNFGYIVTDIETYKIMQPDMATIKYLDGEELHILYYDFINKKYSENKKETVIALGWPNTEISKLIPKPELEVGELLNNSETSFAFIGRGADTSFYDNYVKECKNKGFNKEIDSSSSSGLSTYQAFDSNGVKLHILFDSDNKEVSIDVENPENENK